MRQRGDPRLAGRRAQSRRLAGEHWTSSCTASDLASRVRRPSEGRSARSPSRASTTHGASSSRAAEPRSRAIASDNSLGASSAASSSASPVSWTTGSNSARPSRTGNVGSAGAHPTTPSGATRRPGLDGTPRRGIQPDRRCEAVEPRHAPAR